MSNVFFRRKTVYNGGVEKIQKKYRVRRAIAMAVLMLSSAMVTFAGLWTLSWVADTNSSNELRDALGEVAQMQEVEDDDNTETSGRAGDTANDYWDFIRQPLISVNFSELLAKNSDTVGWINVKSTNINYPIVQRSDNEYYLKHAFDGSRNGAGWVFADFRNNMKQFDKNTIFYGHSRLDGAMFGSLKNALGRAWYNDKNNHVILLSTPTENTMWQVFSTYQIGPESYYLTTSFINNNEYATFLETLKGRSVHDFEATAGVEDKILTISTCANNAAEDRIVVHARLIKTQKRV